MSQGQTGTACGPPCVPESRHTDTGCRQVQARKVIGGKENSGMAVFHFENPYIYGSLTEHANDITSHSLRRGTAMARHVRRRG